MADSTAIHCITTSDFISVAKNNHSCQWVKELLSIHQNKLRKIKDTVHIRCHISVQVLERKWWLPVFASDIQLEHKNPLQLCQNVSNFFWTVIELNIYVTFLAYQNQLR